MRGGSSNPAHTKNRCRAAFIADGEQAMRKLASKLGVTSPAKVNRWAEEFSGVPSSRQVKAKIVREPLTNKIAREPLGGKVAREPLGGKKIRRGIGARVKLTRWALGESYEGARGVLIKRSGETSDPFTVKLDDGFIFDMRDYEFEYIEK